MSFFPRKQPVKVLLTLCFIVLVNPLQANTLTVVTELSPPFQTFEDGHIGGSATEKVRDFLNRSQIPFQINIYPWARAFHIAQNQPNTMIYAIAKTPTRLEKFHWFIPVYDFQPYLVGLSNDKTLVIEDLEQAKTKAIAVQRNDFAHDYLLSQGFEVDVNLILTNSIVDSWHLLKIKKVDFVVETLDYDPTNFNQLNGNYEKYLPLKDLWQSTYLAANKKLDKKILEQLKSTMAKSDKD